MIKKIFARIVGIFAVIAYLPIMLFDMINNTNLINKLKTDDNFSVAFFVFAISVTTTTSMFIDEIHILWIVLVILLWFMAYGAFPSIMYFFIMIATLVAGLLIFILILEWDTPIDSEYGTVDFDKNKIIQGDSIAVDIDNYIHVIKVPTECTDYKTIDIIKVQIDPIMRPGQIKYKADCSNQTEKHLRSKAHQVKRK